VRIDEELMEIWPNEVCDRWTSREVPFIKDSLGGAEYNIPLCVANKFIAIILIPNEYHEFRAQCKFICANFIGEIYICSTTKDMEV